VKSTASNTSNATTVAIAKLGNAEFPLKTWTKAAYAEEVPSEATYDAQGQRDGFTFGKQQIDNPEITLKLSEWLRWRAALLASSGGLGVCQSIFDFPFSYGNTINAQVTDVLQGCHVTKDMRETDLDGGALMVTIPLFVTSIKWAGGPFIRFDP
jgi:hypothetical protein